MEEVDQLIEALNPRGHRESSLKEALLQERERLNLLLQHCDTSKYSVTGNAHLLATRAVLVPLLVLSSAHLQTHLCVR